eukprot:UN11003
MQKEIQNQDENYTQNIATQSARLTGSLMMSTTRDISNSLFKNTEPTATNSSLEQDMNHVSNRRKNRRRKFLKLTERLNNHDKDREDFLDAQEREQLKQSENISTGNQVSKELTFNSETQDSMIEAPTMLSTIPEGTP